MYQFKSADRRNIKGKALIEHCPVALTITNCCYGNY